MISWHFVKTLIKVVTQREINNFVGFLKFRYDLRCRAFIIIDNFDFDTKHDSSGRQQNKVNKIQHTHHIHYKEWLF